jgi:hypothetical protein
MNIASMVRDRLDRLIGGRGEHSITVPVLDGALKPNDRLERADSVAMVEGVDNIVALGGKTVCSSGSLLLSVGTDGAVETMLEAEAPVSCLAAGPGGALAIGLDGQGIRILGGRHDGRLIGRIGSMPLACPTDAAFLDQDRLVVANGSAEFRASEWRHDLLHRGRTGTAAVVNLADGSVRELAGGLAFPTGLCLDRDDPDAVLVSEAWRHRVLRIGAGGTQEVLGNLPAYPGRMQPASAGGYWLACFAIRSQLQEFVLRENRYRLRMIAEVDPDFWIAPSLSSGKSFKEPLQAGGVIRLGVHKPWAPTRSYGLVIRLDREFQPVWSLHSRADGTRHGITSVLETDGRLLATSKGRGEIVAAAHTALSEPDDFASEDQAA